MNWRRALRLSAGIATLALVAACSTAPATRVVLLPQADGSPSAVVVRSKDGEETLSRPYERATAAAGARGAPIVDRSDPARLRADNKDLFDLLPPPAQRYTVYFDTGGAVLTATSRIAMNESMRAALARSGGELVLTGHTDTVGVPARNDELSRQRAQQVRLMFLAQGFTSTRIEAIGRGERDLAIQTADEVSEPRNRRVTIEVR